MDCCANLKDPTIMAKGGATLHQPEEHKKIYFEQAEHVIWVEFDKVYQKQPKA